MNSNLLDVLADMFDDAIFASDNLREQLVHQWMFMRYTL